MAAKKTMTVGDFLKADPEGLELSLLTGGKHLGRVIREPMINRPGLALAGYLQYFANKRLQIIGLAELSYLKSLSADIRKRNVEAFFKARVPGVVITRNRKVPDVIREAAIRYKVPVLRTKKVTGRFINRATVVLEQLTAPEERVYGTMVDIMSVGVLITGEPGVGKSEAALALIERGHSLVSDDVTQLRRAASGRIMGRAPEATKYHLEIRGLGIVHVSALYGVNAVRREKELNLIVELVHAKPGEPVERAGLDNVSRVILGEDIAFIRLPVSIGRDMANVLEVAALNQKLKCLGFDAARELNQKIIEGLLN